MSGRRDPFDRLPKVDKWDDFFAELDAELGRVQPRRPAPTECAADDFSDIDAIGRPDGTVPDTND